ncbi:unnamed protein product [Lymnaea stagnalis]|uniref:Snurportin-1 n=1 Tax=Lymnaea stagnalis TaxID=6523 RepID=A0AAV2IFE4_LYMST
MDELTAALAGSFEISNEPNKTSAPHPRFTQYKQRTSNSDQDTRRKLLLENQKNRRFDFLNHIRKLTDGSWNADPKFKQESNIDDSMEVEEKYSKPGRFYKDQLMLSEWLVEVPSDFATEWITVLCPVAKRCLIVASKGTTRAYTKSGYCMNSFPSHLPGGYRKNVEKETTILDCLFNEATQTYYILDLMCWNGHTIYDTETEFRFYWLHEKLKETQSLQVASSTNPYKFIGLPGFRCIQEDISLAVTSAEFEIDGVLFYHKRTHYTFGSTPLVVWLKPYMLQEILGIVVPDHQMCHMPNDYSNYADHMKKVVEDKERDQKKREERRGRRRKVANKNNSSMEISQSEIVEAHENVSESSAATKIHTGPANNI